MQTNPPLSPCENASVAWDERLPIEDGIYHAHHDSAHLDEHLSTAVVAVLELSSLQSLDAHTPKIYRCS